MQQDNTITLEDIQRHSGYIMLEFGTSWCAYCIAAQQHISAALHHQVSVKHIKIEDGKGKRLGRSYAVKLWPTLIFLKDGVELIRIARPSNQQCIQDALSLLQGNFHVDARIIDAQTKINS